MASIFDAPVKKSIFDAPVDYKGTLGELPLNNPLGSTKTTTQMFPDQNVKGIPIEALNPVPIAQGIARTVGTVGITAGNIPTQVVNVGRSIFDKAPQPLPFEQSIPTTGNKITETLFGGVPLTTVQEQTKNLQPKTGIAALPIVLGSIAADLFGLGGGKLIPSIIRETTKEGAIKILTKMGTPEDVAKIFAPRLVATKTEAEAKLLLEDIKKTQGALTKPIPDVLVPIAEKARTLTPEEFSAQFKAGLEAQNLTTRQTAENVFKEMQNAGFDTPGVFHAVANKEVTKVSQELLPQLGKVPSQGELGIQLLPGTRPTTEVLSSLEKTVSETQSAVNKITEALKKTIPLNKEQKALYSEERSKRAGAVVAVGKAVPGERGYVAQLGQLKGELPKVQFQSIRNAFGQKEIDSLFNAVEQSHLLPYEKISAKTGLAKLLGKEGGSLPVPSEVALLNEVFPPEFIKAIQDNRPLLERLFGLAADVANIPRALMSSFDLSAPLRQGVLMIGRKEFYKAFANMFRYAVSEKGYQELMRAIKTDAAYGEAKDAGLAITNITNPSLNAREEAFMSNLAEKIPGIGKIVRASDRAYTGFLDKLRFDTFKSLLADAKAQDLVRGNDKIVKDIATYVNTATGRGNLSIFGKDFSRLGPTLNAVFFSPRLMASRIQTLNPIYYIQLDPFVRKEALKSLLTFSATAGTVLGLAKLGGADVGIDPTSSDFGKIKVGDTRYDVFAGFQQYIRLAAQLAAGKVTSSTSGREITLGEGYKPLTRLDVIQRFFASKEAPIVGFISGLLSGQDMLGRSFNAPTEIVNRVTPMMAQDLFDLYQEGGLKDLVYGLPTPFGVGTQTYGKVELKTGVNPIGEPTAQIAPPAGLGEAITAKMFGPQPLGSSRGFDVQTYYDQLKALPPEEAKAKLKEIAGINPDLAKSILKVVADQKAGITAHDQDLKAKDIKSGERAMAVVKDLNKLNTSEEKKALLKSLVVKKVINEEVLRQIVKILGDNQR